MEPELDWLELKDPIIVELKRFGWAITRENYLAIDDPEADPEEMLHAEHEASLPRALQLHPGTIDND